MLRSSVCRGQTEPLVVLIAVLAMIAGVGLYGEAFAERTPLPEERDRAAPLLDRVVVALSPGAVVHPTRLDAQRVERLVRNGLHVRIEIRAGKTRWDQGPTPPRTAQPDVATRSLVVRVGPNTVRLGRIRVIAWP